MTLGTMATDVEQRIDFDAMRAYRLQRAREQMEKYDLGAILCFDLDNIRYITSTHLAEWARGKYWRWCLLPRDADPILFEVGSAGVWKERLCPWLKPEDIRTAVGWMRGANALEVNRRLSQNAINEIKAELEKHGVADMPIAVDEVEMYIVTALEEAGLKVANGYDAMFDARIIKSPEELAIIELSASLVDGVYSQIFDRIKPGVKENEIVGWIYGWLIEHGVDRISGVNCVSGPRSNPHPHDYSDRMIRPGDLVFIDIMSHYLGYSTCYYRTFAVTHSSPNQRAVYKRAFDWLQASIDQVKPGATTAEVASVWPTAQELGYESEEQAFALALGHGIGISHHEKPWISRAYSLDNPITLETGMHFALETFYGEGDDGARIESQVIVTEDGNKVITKFPCEELLVCNPIG